MEFGDVLHELRTQAGIGIKRLAPALGVTYSYLSKLESNQLYPSEELVIRAANYFGYDSDRMLLAANKIPPDIREILRDNPEEAISYLRRRFGAARDSRPKS